MNTVVFHDDEPAGDEPRTSLLWLFINLVSLADRLGYVVTIEQIPQTPLAMGNYTARVDLRRRRERATPIERGAA